MLKSFVMISDYITPVRSCDRCSPLFCGVLFLANTEISVADYPYVVRV